ncbi:hypothetical protein MHH42_30950 [Bacillus sp. FSL L8-0099]|uniref:hypothetical protein n=1 Tax=unclassified Bacillus (in: firmicutes) TaxID=185979 RepID=UPI0030F7EEBF|nr:hypothetical protein [Bacillus cereus]
MEKLLAWLEQGVSLGKITGYALAFQEVRELGLRRYMVGVQHASMGEIELNVAIQGTTVLISHENRTIETITW